MTNNQNAISQILTSLSETASESLESLSSIQAQVTEEAIRQRNQSSQISSLCISIMKQSMSITDQLHRLYQMVIQAGKNIDERDNEGHETSSDTSDTASST